MSGIAGAVHVDGRVMSEEVVRRIVAAGAPRGADGVSSWRGGAAGLIRHHHATTPEAVGETQPLELPGSGAMVLLDGRLDNRTELFATLGDDRLPRGASDCALAAALYERFGMDCVTRLVGDWALVVWSPRDRQLFCARSAMGWRPFLWSMAGGTFGFATEPRALIHGLGLDRRLNEGAIGELLSMQFATRTDTFWSALQRLEQGAALTLTDGRLRFWHWHDRGFEDGSRLSDRDHVERFNALFSDAVAATSRCSTTVSAHLSGGLDSSAVVARAIELHRAGRIEGAVQAISARFPGTRQDETRFSSAVEAHVGIAARVTAAADFSFADAGQFCADTLQLPVRPNVYDTTVEALRLMEREGSRVLLTGEGGDDWLAGAGIGHFPDLFLAGQWGALIRAGLHEGPGDPAWRRLLRTARHAIGPLTSARARKRHAMRRYPAGGHVPAWIGRDWAREIGLVERLNAVGPATRLPGYAMQQRYGVYALAQRHNNFEPVMALAERHGVELRHPFHDLRLTRFLIGAAPHMLRHDGERKVLLRQAMVGTLPELVRTRQDKPTFETSTRRAVVERVRSVPVADMRVVRMGWVDGAALSAIVDRIAAATPDEDPPWVNAAWFAIAIDLWLEHAAGM